MKKRSYKLLAFGLCVCMIVGLVPTVTPTEAKAAETSAQAFAVRVAEDGETATRYFSSLDDAIEAAKANGPDDKTVTITDPALLTADAAGSLSDGVKLVDADGSSYAGDGTEFTIEKSTGEVTITGTPENGVAVTPKGDTKAAFGVTGKSGSHEVTAGKEAAVRVAKEDGKVTGAAVKVAATDSVAIDGVTYTGTTEYDVDDPFGKAADGTTATVPPGRNLNVGEKDGKLWSVDAGGKSAGKDPVTVKKNADGKIAVTIPGDTGATVTGSGDPVTYEGPVTLEIDKNGTIAEVGNNVPKEITVRRDGDGKIDSNGQPGLAERLMPVLEGTETDKFVPGATYYWRINGENAAGNGSDTIRDPDGGVWYTAVAGEDGTLRLNTQEKKTLVYGDYVEISGSRLIRTDPVKVRLLSRELLNGDFSMKGTPKGAGSDWGVYTPRSGVYGWRTSASNTPGGGWTHYTLRLLTDGRAELCSEESASIYQEIDTSGGESYTWSLEYMARTDGGYGESKQEMAVVIGPLKDEGDYQKPNNASGTKDMFQDLVSKLKRGKISPADNKIFKQPTASNPMTGPYVVKVGGNTYTIWLIMTGDSWSSYTGTVETKSLDGENLDEMVFALTAVETSGSAEGGLVRRVKFQGPDPVYTVNGRSYATLESAVTAAAKEEGDRYDVIITRPELMGKDVTQEGVLPGGVKLIDRNGGIFTGGENGAKVAVDSKGKVTVLGGEAAVAPKTGGKNGVAFGVLGAAEAPHDVIVKGEAAVTVTEAGGKVTVAAVKPEAPADEVTIDGVTYSAAADAAYNVDDSFGGAPDGTTARVPAPKDGEPGCAGLTVPGAENGKGFTVKPVTDGGGITVTKGANSETSTLGGAVKGTVEVGGDGKDGKVNVNGVTYTVPADARYGAKLGLVTKDGAGGAKEDVVELLEGAVDVGGGQDVYVNGKEVRNAGGAGTLKVTKDAEGGTAHVAIPGGARAGIGGVEYTGEATVDIDRNGVAAISKGTVKLPKNKDGVDVDFEGGSVHVENASGPADKEVTVVMPKPGDPTRGQASVPNGGAVSIGPKDGSGATYDATKENTVFEFNSEGKVSLQSGGTSLGDERSIGFGDVTLGNDKTETRLTASAFAVDVIMKPDGKGAGKAAVIVPAGETFTVDDGEGNRHTYKNNGTGDLELTVNETGKVSVKGNELPGGGIELGENTPITVTDGKGENPNDLIAGVEKTVNDGEKQFKTPGGATLKKNTKTEADGVPAGEQVPLLSEGSVRFPDAGGSVTVKDMTNEGKEKLLEGKNVEVFAGEKNVKSLGNKKDGKDGEVKVEGSTTYYIPDGRVSEMNNGTFGYPAKGEMKGNKDGPGAHPFVLVPDGDNGEGGNGKLFLDNRANDDDAGGANSNVAAEAGPGFSIKKKIDGGGKDDLAEGSYGHYEGAAGTDGAKLTVDHERGAVTLTDGSVTMTKETPAADGEYPAIFLKGIKETGGTGLKVVGEDVTVTMPGENGSGADVKVPAGKSVRIGEPNVSLDAPDNDVKIGLDSGGGFDVELEPGESVTVNGRTYTNEGDTGGTVHIDENGGLTTTPNTEGAFKVEVRLPAKNLKLKEGDVLEYTTPDGKEVTLKGEKGGGVVDLDANGSVTGRSGKVRVKGGVKTRRAEDAPAGTRVTQVGDVEIQVVDDNNKAVEGAEVTVTLSDGEEYMYRATTDENGAVRFEDVPYGAYKVDVKKTEGGTEYSSTGSLTVDAPSVTGRGGSFLLYGFAVDTRVESDLDTSAPAVGNLDSVVTSADKAAQGGGTVINVTLKANTLGVNSSAGMTETDVTEIMAGLRGAADDIDGVTDPERAITDMVDVTVEKTVTKNGVEGAPEPQPTTPALLTLTFRISDELAGRLTGGVTMENIFVLRQHGDNSNAQLMRKVSASAGRTASFECYYVEELNGVVYIVIRARNFSVYAFGVSNEAIEAHDPAPSGGGFYPGVGGVTAPKAAHGSVTVDPKAPRPGAAVTVTPKPDFGYEMGELKVTDIFGHSVAVSDNGNGAYSFRMPAFGAVVNASFRKCPSLGFPDIDRNSWYHTYTDYVISHGLMRGMDTGLFEPEGQVTRAQFVMTLWSMERNPGVKYDLKFPDVKEGQWFTEAIRWAASEGIIFGYDNGSFGPNDPVTRDQMVAMLYRYEQKKGGGYVGESVEFTFTDKDKIGGWCREAVAWSVKTGVIAGKDGAFDPYGAARRNELAVVLTQYAALKTR